ncbi:ribosomal protection-like ABC-F family protein [Deinococcus maricopensis]|uniref:ABC transporter related protein n=1 Tax=Deinococcus maricopensis (strain DSM 21211 / LMG 22137 / NRRL B-23946 / LB-34) TaxID=709986 RepID=E8U9H0_DEIML|nr:ABC-F family ATP-binding cassette domain-containing protein [Deinococcus maricopensis]ADV67709.1 ABC transporter related protein [Deinococcus maricopensis DSM 21211]
MLVALQGIHKDYGAQTVLNDLTLKLNPGDRVGLVGRNGAGKTTLLRLITGEEKPDLGTVRFLPGVRAAALRQDPFFPDGATVRTVLDAAFTELDALEAELEQAAHAMGDGTDASIHHHEQLLEQYARRGGFERRSRRDAVTLAFGFRGREDDLAARLSGGERTRLSLAALLIQNPDVLLLDEPTNHLDIGMVEWLENFLSRYPGAVMVISHDRAFLDAVTNQTAHLWHGQARLHAGGYTQFRAALDEELERQAARYAQEQRRIADYQRSVDRMKIWGLGMSKLARRAKGMQARADRMRATATKAPPPDERTTRITFHAPESGDVVLDARHLTRALGGRTLFRDVNVQLRRGDRVALIGRNGAGKTTLLRTLLGLDASDDPRSQVLTGARVTTGYYDQQLRGVDPDSTLYQEAREYVEKDQQAHDLLGTFMFPYDAHDKPARVLSGGERARLALLKLAQEDHNFLVLDEPSNHLDMEMLESLEEALEDFSGTLLMVSHDRALIENLADRIWLIEDGQFHEYPGGYAYYKQKHLPAEAPTTTPAKPASATPAKPKGKGLWHLKRQLEAIEADIAALEAELGAAQAALGHADANADFAALGGEVARLEAALNDRMDAWAKAHEDVEAAGG